MFSRWNFFFGFITNDYQVILFFRDNNSEDVKLFSRR